MHIVTVYRYAATEVDNELFKKATEASSHNNAILCRTARRRSNQTGFAGSDSENH